MSATTTSHVHKLRTLRSLRKPEDVEAMNIRFGVELETKVPRTCGLAVGGYHVGYPVRSAIATNGQQLVAPTFHGATWRADRDGSITCEANEMPCEFVSPILHGAEGVDSLCRFMDWMSAIGATVDNSCGVHITVGIESVIGSTESGKVSEFVRKLAHIAQWHAMSLYGQTGTGRHLSRYSHTLADDVARHMRKIVNTSSIADKETAAVACGRGMLNLQKSFRMRGAEYVGAVEFRVFAGTTSVQKVLHHLATVLGLCRRANQVQCLGAFRKNKLQMKRTQTAESAVRFLCDYLGWTGGARPCALGLFGRLHREFSSYGAEAMRLCQKFDERYPEARL
jgi:hypothetical protein